VSAPRKGQPTQLPKGAKIYLPDEAARKRAVEERLFEVFRRWGYREVVTSAYEYFDVLSQGTDQELQERMFKMVDRESGRLLALRADVTPQIARIVATRMRDEPKPLRLAYDSDPIAKQIVDVAQGLEGIVRNSSIHAAAVVIAGGEVVATAADAKDLAARLSRPRAGATREEKKKSDEPPASEPKPVDDKGEAKKRGAAKPAAGGTEKPSGGRSSADAP